MDIFFDDKTKTQIKDIVIRSGLGSIPLAGPAAVGVYEFFNVCLTRAKELKNDDFKNRILKFQDELNPEKLNINYEDIINKDNIKIIETMLRDDEDKKTTCYASLFSTFVNSNIKDEEKIYLIKWLRDLTCFDLDTLRKVYIFQNNDIIHSRLTNSELGKHSIEKIEKMGLIHKQKGPTPETTTLGLNFLNSIYKENQLQPSAFNLRTYRNISFNMISMSDLSTDDKKEHQQILTKLTKLFYDELDCRCSSPKLLNSQFVDYNPLLFTGKIILVHDGKIKKDYISKIEKVLIASKGIVICVPKEQNKNSLQHLSSNDSVLSYTIKDNQDVEEMLNSLRDIFKTAFKHASPNWELQ